jgi:hypothetical protein
VADLFAPPLPVEPTSVEICENIKTRTQSIRPAQNINRFIITNWYFLHNSVKSYQQNFQ